MKKPYVPYDLGLALKEKGFKGICIYHYKVGLADPKSHTNIPTFEIKAPFGANHNQAPTRVSAPLWSEVCDWIYEASDKAIIVNYNPSFSLEFMTDEILNAIKRW